MTFNGNHVYMCPIGWLCICVVAGAWCLVGLFANGEIRLNPSNKCVHGDFTRQLSTNIAAPEVAALVRVGRATVAPGPYSIASHLERAYIIAANAPGSAKTPLTELPHVWRKPRHTAPLKSIVSTDPDFAIEEHWRDVAGAYVTASKYGAETTKKFQPNQYSGCIGCGHRVHMSAHSSDRDAAGGVIQLCMTCAERKSNPIVTVVNDAAADTGPAEALIRSDPMAAVTSLQLEQLFLLCGTVLPGKRVAVTPEAYGRWVKLYQLAVSVSKRDVRLKLLTRALKDCLHVWLTSELTQKEALGRDLSTDFILLILCSHELDDLAAVPMPDISNVTYSEIDRKST